ncbi:unnamed protein product [Vitrella brassicaformis CCMP3155]|uniref:Uncharacterized protein n=1 Tax=Vitrella brassicaformis (strain CCMP3155) TaxID=1169540 RepID=A0A0G4GST3_VITBC|nr:unnamed protein product [Vitrella brassicaformis CCMP3155]|eukprot:CEM33759.1 unnamed protein product [Vitrella brassicaformis CCMP3155]
MVARTPEVLTRAESLIEASLGSVAAFHMAIRTNTQTNTQATNQPASTLDILISVESLIGHFLVDIPPAHLPFTTRTLFGRRVQKAIDKFVRFVATNRAVVQQTGGQGSGGNAQNGWSLQQQLDQCKCFVIGGVGGQRVGLRDVIEKARREEAAEHGLTIDHLAGAHVAFQLGQVGTVSGFPARFESLQLAEWWT